MVLVGFGKHDLKDLWAKKDTKEGLQRLIEAITIKHWPPRYRRLEICTEEEVKVFKEYLHWIVNELNPPKKERFSYDDSNSLKSD